jgi:hypothetical protein
MPGLNIGLTDLLFCSRSCFLDECTPGEDSGRGNVFLGWKEEKDDKKCKKGFLSDEKLL